MVGGGEEGGGGGYGTIEENLVRCFHMSLFMKLKNIPGAIHVYCCNYS